VATMLGQHRLLFSGRKQTITRHARNVVSSTDKFSKGEATIPPPEARDFHAAATT
jgi:hypothetical protein